MIQPRVEEYLRNVRIIENYVVSFMKHKSQLTIFQNSFQFAWPESKHVKNENSRVYNVMNDLGN